MKKIITLTAAAVMTLGAWAQNEHVHVFRNDKQFNSYKGSDIKNITVLKGASDFETMVVTGTDGTETKIAMSAVDSCQFKTSGLPEIYVNLTDYPDWDDLKKSEPYYTKNTEYAATLRIDGNGMYNDIPSQAVVFRGRGNSTWNMPKTPYRFKMEKKAAVCKLPKAKTFALIANYIDCTLMRNAVALWIANYLEMPFANHCVPVRVYFNDKFKGAYMLTEKIGIGGGSVDIDEYKGILFELDSNYDEDFKFQYTWTPSGSWGSKILPVMVKDPDFTEVCDSIGVTTGEYLSKWQADFSTMANAVTSRASTQSLSDVLDIEQAVNFFIVNGIANNHEMKHPKSFYIHKDSLGTDNVYKLGPVWDFDWAYTYDGSSYDGEQASYSEPLVVYDGDKAGASFLKCLFANEEFRTLFKQKLDAFMEDGWPKLQAYMEDYANLIEPSALENGLLWPSDTSVSWRKSLSSWTFRTNFSMLKTWLQNRLNFMQSHSNFGLYQ